MGYWIADTEMTQYYLDDLMVEIMWDASFWGIEQEHLARAQKELDEASNSKTSYTVLNHVNQS